MHSNYKYRYIWLYACIYLAYIVRFFRGFYVWKSGQNFWWILNGELVGSFYVKVGRWFEKHIGGTETLFFRVILWSFC